MSAPTSAMRLVPRYLGKPWGGRRIARHCGREIESDEPIGESWEFYDRPEAGSSGVGGGPPDGVPIAGLPEDRPPFPLMTKIIDARETLSIQVHPDRETAVELGGEEKTEAWYVLEAADGSRIWKGFREGVTREEVDAAKGKEGFERLVHSYPVAAGDVVFIPAGTVHAIGAGILLYEVQQNSDTTYRFWDWESDRELHLEEALRAAHCDGPGLERVAPRLVSDEGAHRVSVRVSCPEFVLEEHEAMGTFTFGTERRGLETWHVLFVVDGRGAIRPFSNRAEETRFACCDSILLPAEHESYEIECEADRTVRLLAAHVPGRRPRA